MNVLVYSYNLRHHLLYFDKLWYLHKFFFDSLHFIDLWQFYCFLDNFLDYSLNCYYIVYVLFYCNNFFDNSGNFFDDLLNIWYNFFNLFYLLLNEYLFNIFLDLPEFDYLLDNRYYLFNDLRSGDDSLSDLLFGNYLLDNCLYRHWDLKGHNHLLLDLNSFHTLVSQMNYFLNFYLHRHFLDHSDGNLLHDLLRNNLFFVAWNFDWLLNNGFEWLLDLDVNILNCLHLFNDLLNYRHLNNFLNFNDLLSDNFLFNNFFYQLGYLDYFFNNSWNHYYFFDYFLNLDHFGDFYHFLNDLFNLYRYFFDPVDDSGDFDDFFFNVLDGFRNFDIYIDELFDF